MTEKPKNLRKTISADIPPHLIYIFTRIGCAIRTGADGDELRPKEKSHARRNNFSHGRQMQDDNEDGRRATSPSDVIDTDIIRAVAGNDSEVIRELISEFLPGARAGIAQISLAADHGAAERVQAASHSLKGACVLVGARHLVALCSGLETAARLGDWRLVRELFAQVEPRMREVEIAAEAVLRQIESG